MTLVEPGGYATDWAGSSAHHSEPKPAYDDIRAEAAARRGAAEPGDPDAAARVLLQVVDSPAPPLRVLLGAAAPGVVRRIDECRLAQWVEWEELAHAAQG